jgi:hypothetical protein
VRQTRSKGLPRFTTAKHRTALSSGQRWLKVRLVQISFFSTLSIHLHSCQGGPSPSTLSSRLSRRRGMERTRISYIAVPDEVTYAAFRKERRMRFANAVKPIQFFFDFSALVVSHKGVAWRGNRLSASDWNHRSGSVWRLAAKAIKRRSRHARRPGKPSWLSNCLRSASTLRINSCDQGSS